MERQTLKITTNTDNIVEFMYNDPKTGTNNYGDWYLYAVQHDGQEKGLFATAALHDKLKSYGKGDRVNIRKEEFEPNKFKWNIIPEEGTPPRTQVNGRAVSISNDERTHDIHKQVCLKLAVELMGKLDNMLTDGQLVIIEANMKSLLSVLEGREENTDDFPF